MTPEQGTPALGYVRVSTREQGDSGHGLAAQETAIRAACERRGWRLESVYQDVISSRKKRRPQLAAAIAHARELGGVLVAAKVSRPARSTRELLALHERSINEGWALITLDLEHVDTTTPQGKAFLGMMAVFAEFERDLVSERTREGLAAAKVNGTRSGRAIGRPRGMDEATLDQLRELRARGTSYRMIAEVLNARGVLGPQNGQWYKQSVHQACKRYDIRAPGSTSGASHSRSTEET